MPENYINRPATALNLPATPIVPNVNSVSPTDNLSAADMWKATLQNTAIGGTPEIPLNTVYSGNRYDATTPGTNYEEMSAQQQTWGDKMVNGVGKGLALTGTTFLQSTIGLVNGTVKAVHDGKLSSFYNNELNRTLDDFNKNLEDEWANYYTTAERENHWYSPKKFFSANFFWDGIIKNLGFSAGAALSGGVFAATLKGLSSLPGLAKMMSIGKNAEALAASEELIGIGKATEALGKIKSGSDKFLSTFNTLNTGQRITVAGLATTGEAGFEAYNNLNQFREAKIQAYKEEHNGMVPLGQELEEINKNAEDLGNWSLGLNIALLSATNYIQFPKILGSSYTVEKGMINSLTRGTNEIIEEGGKYVAKTSGKGTLSTLNKVRPYLFSSSEAFEEGAQFAITKGTEDYFDKKYNNQDKSIINSLVEGVRETLTTDEGMENVLIGGLSGSIMMGIGRYKTNSREQKNTTDALQSGKWNNVGLNSANLSDFTKETIASVNRGVTIQEEREQLLKQGDVSGSKDKEADYIINYLAPRIKFGRFDLVKSDIDTHKQLASTEEGWKQLQSEGKALEGDSREAYLNRILALENTANNVKSLYQSLHLRYGSQVDDKGTPLYTSAVMDKLVYAASKVADYDTRLTSLTGVVIGKGIDVNTLIKDVLANNYDSFNTTVNSINALDIIDDEKVTLIESIEDILKLSVNRNKFLKEYSEIKSSPKKFQEQKVETPSSPTGEKITITDKEGEREVEIGEEYYLGAIDYTEGGIKKKRFPRLTILGENENGTIKAKDASGKIRDIDRKELESYKLGKVADVEKSENSKFYFRNVIKFPDTKVFWNTGKAKAGKIEGQLQYDGKNDKLFFVYAQNGKTKYKEVGIDQFSPKEGFKEGVFSFDRALSVEDTADITTRATSGKTLKDQEARRGDKLRILNNLYKEIVTKSEKTDKLLEQKKAELENIRQELEELEEKIMSSKNDVDKRFKKVTFKPAMRKALDVASRLSKMQDQLEKEISDLEKQKENLDIEKEDITPYIEDMTQNIDELPSSTSEFLKDLKEQKDLLEDAIVGTMEELDSVKSIYSKVQDALDSAIDFVNDLISSFKKKFYNAPTSIANEWIGTQVSPGVLAVSLVGNEEWANFLQAHPNFLKQKPTYKEELKQLEDMVAQIDDLDVIPGERQVKELKDNIILLQEELKQQENRLKTLDKVIAKFEEIAKKNEERKQQEQLVANNTALQQQLLGTHTKDVQNIIDNKQLETPKKETLNVVNSTTASSDFDKPHQLRANNFGFRLPKLGKKFKSVIVTSDTEDQILPGLTRHLLPQDTSEYKADEIIALVIVDEDGNLVDEFGNVITEDALNQAIYQVFPLSKLTAKYEDKSGVKTEESMFREDVSPEIQKSLREQYSQWRNNQLEQTVLGPPQGFDTSFGTPQYVKKIRKDKNGNDALDKNGNLIWDNDYDARTSVKDAGLIKDSELEEKQLVAVGTSNDSVTEGTTTFNNALGRVFLKLAGFGLVKLENRKFNSKEANTIFDVIQQVSKNTLDSYNAKLSKEEREQAKENNTSLHNWLKSVVYWGIPKDFSTGERKSPKYNSIFFETIEENGKSVIKLFISGIGTSFDFTPTALQANKATIITLLEGMYNNTNATLVNDRAWNKTYYEITGIDTNGNPTTKEWKNYQTYLLSSEGRKAEEIPLATRLKPLKDENDANRKGIYFTLTQSEYTLPKEPIKKGIEFRGEPKKEETEKSEEKKVESFVLDGTTVNTITLGTFGSTTFVLDAEKYITSEGKVGFNPTFDGTLTQVVMTAKSITEDAARNIIALSILRNVKPQLDAIALSKVKENPIEETSEEEDDEWNNAETGEDEDSEYRLQLVKQANKFEEEDWNKVEQWLKANFPNLPVYRVKNMIQATNSRQAWGMLHNAALYLTQHAEGGTVYHEVFEAVWKLMSSQEEKTNIISEFKSRKGSFEERDNPESIIKYSEATNAQIKEELAEEFRDYIMFQKAPVKEGKSWISKMFYDVVRMIKEFFTGSKALSNTEQLFERIGTGYYKEYNPFASKLSFANVGIMDVDNAFADDTSDMRLENIPAQQVHEVIQHMTYSTLVELIETDKSLFSIQDLNKKVLYERLQKEIFQKIRNKGKQFETAAANGEMKEDVAAREVGNLKALWKNIKNQWVDVVAKHQEQLLSYGVEFDENDVLTITDENNSGKSDYQDARKIDHFRKANSAIKMLFATIPITENGKPKKSTIGGVITMPADEVYITIKNNLYDSRNIDEMFSKLAELAVGNPNYIRLYRRLTKTEPSKSVNFNKLDEEGLHLVNAFWKSMKSQNPDVMSVFIQANGEVVVGQSSFAGAAKQAKRDMFHTMVNKIKEGTPYISYEAKTGVYNASETLIKYELKSGNLETYIKFLNTLGIEFNEKDIPADQLTKFRKTAEGIKKSLVKIKDVVALTSRSLDLEGRLLELGEIKAIIENPQFESTYFNINGERVQGFLGTNVVSNLYDVLSKISNINNELPEEYKYLLTDSFAVGSVLLNMMFNLETGNRREGSEGLFKTAYIDGTINEQTGKKKESSKLTHKERLVQDLNMNSYGYYMNLVPGDASIEHAIYMHSADAAFISEEEFKNNKHLEVFKNYFISEVKLARENRRVVGSKNAKDLRFFKSILGEELHKEIMAKENSIYTPEEVYDGYKGKINAAVNTFIKEDASDVELMLRSYGVIYQGEEGLVADGLAFMQNTEVTDANISSKLKQLSVNYMIANIELHKLVYSDPYQYADELKRIKNFNSPRQPLVHGSVKISEALNKKYNQGYTKDDIGYTDMTKEHFSTITLGDVFSTDELPEYDKPYEETDGGGYLTLKALRVFKIRAGEWSQDNERQYRYDTAYEKYYKGIALTAEEEKIFDVSKKGKDNPSVKDTYTVLKPIVSGNKANGRRFNDVVMDKYALIPLSYRILHEINPESNALKLYDKMQKEGIDYGVYSTGRKVGAEVVTPLYNEDGSFNNSPIPVSKENQPQAIINIPFSIIGVQSEVPSKDVAQVTQGSQITKLVTMDFLEAGMPIDFLTEAKFEDRFVAWTNLDAEEKRENASLLYKEIKNNQIILEKRIEQGYKTLLKKLGIEETLEGFRIVDRDKLTDTLTSEILKREVNENITDAFNDFKKQDVVLEATPAYAQIRNILYSIADKNVVSPKISGGMKVQIPSTLLESNRIASTTINGKQAFTSDVLGFYKDEDGKRVCEIMVARWFDSKLNDKELLDYLNNTEEGQKILGGIGFRIPTQKQNSIDVFKIAKFLPKDFGDSVVIPSALVKKVGSDFDIDKLSIYLKNTFESIDRKIKLVELKETEEITKQFYINDYTEKLRTKLEKIANKDEFRISVFNILDKFETVDDTKSFLDFFPNLTEEETEFYLNHREVFEAIRTKAEEENLLPSEYQQRVLDKANNDSAKWMSKLIDENFLNFYGDKMYKEALENAYIQSLENLVSHPLNFKNLIKPNSADQLKGLARDINSKLGRPEIDYSNVGNMLSRRFMTTLRQNFVSGKQAIGIAAVGQTNHSDNQRAVTTIDYERMDLVPEEDKKWLDDGKFHFPKFNKILINGKLLPTLSMIKNQVGDNISDIISQMIDGYVDISKGAWIMELGATPSTAGTWLFLIKAGVPVKTVAYFMNQPIIKEYLQSLENAGYSWLFIDDFVNASQAKFKPSTPISISLIPSETELGDMVGNKTLKDEQLAQQQFILDEFLKYSKMANHLFQVTQGSNFDTANLNDPYLIFKKEKQLEKARKTIISSIDDLLNNSFRGRLRTKINQVRDAFSTILISDRTNDDATKYSVRQVMEAVLTPYINTNDRDFVKISQKAVADLFDWAMQTNTKLNNKVASILLGNESEKSVAQQIIAFRDKVMKNKNHPLFDNLILKSIRLETGDKVGKVQNLKLVGTENKVYDQNQVIAAFRELRPYLGYEKGGLYGKFMRLAVLQSGLTNSPIAFSQLLPYEDFKKIYNETLSSLEDMPNLIDFHSLHVFERNNWANTDIIPFKKDKIKQNKRGDWYYPSQNYIDKPLVRLNKAKADGILPMTITMSVHSQDAKSDFITYSWEKYISKFERIKRRRTSDRSHVQKGLFQKVYTEDENGNRIPLMHSSEDKKTGIVYEKYIYKMINAWGDSFRAKEFYNVEQASVLNNDYIKVEKEIEEKQPNGTIEKKIISAEVEDELVSKILFGENVVSSPVISNTTLMGNINFQEEQSSGYRERTIKNASADATIAIAVDFTSAGERLTKTSVLSQNKKYISVDANRLAVTPERVNGIVNELNSIKKVSDLFSNGITLNIAGNGIYTMKGKYTQEQVDQFTYDLLKAVIESPNLKNKVSAIRTGGQTGFDEAGAKAGLLLNIPTMILAPKGWTFRNISGQDISSESSFKSRFSSTENWSNDLQKGINLKTNDFKC